MKSQTRDIGLAVANEADYSCAYSKYAFVAKQTPEQQIAANNS